MQEFNIKRLVPIFAGVMAFLLVLPYLVSRDNYFVGSLVPEITGVFFEILIVILILDSIRRKQEELKRKKTKEALRHSFYYFIVHVLRESPAPQEAIQLRKQITNYVKSGNTQFEHVDKSSYIHAMYKETWKHSSETKIRQLAQKNLSIFSSLMPVAASLGDEYVKVWFRLIYFTDDLAHNRAELKRSISDLLIFFEKFERINISES